MAIGLGGGEDMVAQPILHHLSGQSYFAPCGALTFAIVAINSGNRLNVPFRTTVGAYAAGRAAQTDRRVV